MPGPGRPFPKGQSGNPTGRRGPNKVTIEIKQWARSVLEDAKVRDKTLALAQAGRLAPAILIELFHYAYGKPKDASDMSLKVVGEAVKVILPPPREKKASE